MRNKRRRAGWSGWIIGLVIAIPLLWVGYWYAAQYVANAAIERVTTRPVAGGRVLCTAHSLSGFPLRLDFGCQRAAFTDDTERQITAELGGLQASAPLYWPGYVEATLGSPLVVNAPSLGVALTASWSDAVTTAGAGLGGLKSASATVHSFDFSSTGGGAIPLRTVKAGLAEASIAPAGGNAYRIGALANDLQVVPANGRVLPALDSEARVVLHDFGGSLGTDPRAALLDWLRKGGTADVERLKLATGNAAADADGKLVLSPDGLLSGTLNLRLRNADAFADLAEAIRPGSRGDMDKVLAVLSALTVPVETPDGPARQTTVVLRNGLVAIGILPVGYIPPLRF